jgi:hypothetical protein
VLLWTRVRHLEFGSFLTTVLSLLELLALGIAIYSLGWWGLALNWRRAGIPLVLNASMAIDCA